MITNTYDGYEYEHWRSKPITEKQALFLAFLGKKPKYTFCDMLRGPAYDLIAELLRKKYFGITSGLKLKNTIVKYSECQKNALQKISEFKNNSKQEFVLSGVAGSGKSSLLLDAIKGVNPTFAAPTGKAAKVISQKTGHEACTLHKLFMKPDDEHLQRVLKKQEIQQVKDNGRKDLLPELYKELDILKELYPLNFRPQNPLPIIDFLVCDEASMVNEEMKSNCLKACKKILWVGDHAQLPPPKNKDKNGKEIPSIVSKENADALLESIQRQCEGSKIIDWATSVRNGKYHSHMYAKPKESSEFRKKADVILVGKNKQRAYMNTILRKEKGIAYDSDPQPGEPLMILKNDYQTGLMNGDTLICISCEIIDKCYEIIGFCTTTGNIVKKKVSIGSFETIEDTFRNEKDKHIGLAYSVTVYKSQGSEWKNVLIMDDWKGFNSYKKWLYTAITRASEDVCIYSISKKQEQNIKDYMEKLFTRNI